MRFDRSLIDVPHMLESLGVQNVNDAGDEVFYSCPFPGHANDDSTPSASMSTVEIPNGKGGSYPPTTFNCYACGTHGEAVSFVAALMDVAPWTAKQWLRRAYMQGFKEPEGGLWDELRQTVERPVSISHGRALPVIDERHLLDRLVDWHLVESMGTGVPSELRYMLDRGFTAKTLESWEIGWDSGSGRIAIPVRDEEGRLVGFKGRSTGDERPKYLVLGGAGRPFPTYDVARVVFGLHRVRGGRAVVHEGELNAIATSEAGLQGIAVGKSHVSEEQLRLIVSRADSAVVWLDDDPAGTLGGTDVAERLHAHMPVRIVRSSRDSAELSPEERVELVAGAKSALLTA